MELFAHILMNSKIIDVLSTFFLFPESQVLLKEFNDGLGVSEVFLRNLINLFKSLLEVLLCKVTCLFVVLKNFVVENGEVQSETQLDGVA